MAGRRPGRPATRREILEAARDVFAEEGYDRASVRAIARQAGVDPALVYHYFDGKPALFVELLELARDPRAVMEAAAAVSGPGRGARVVTGFLQAWEDGDPTPGTRFRTVIQAVCTSPEAATALREFLTERVWSRSLPSDDPSSVRARRASIASQLFGVAFQRYVLLVEPYASASIDEVAALVGPVIDQLHGEMPQSDLDAMEAVVGLDEQR